MARGIEWANANEGLLQGVTMLGGVAALVVSLRQQRGVVAGRADAGPRLPALLWVGPVPDPDPKRWGEVLRSYGGRVETRDGLLRAAFTDASEAARAALELAETLDPLTLADTALLLTEPDADPPELAPALRGGVRSATAIRRPLAEAPDLELRRLESGTFRFAVATPSRFGRVRRLALPAIGLALVAIATLWLLSGNDAATPSVR